MASNAGMELLQQLKILVDTELSPADRIIHKPNSKGTGQALKLQLRVAPKWVPETETTSGYFDKEANKEGGLFLELVPQGPNAGAHATFLWRDEAQVVRCKLGVPDITAILFAIRHYRVQGLELPASYQGKVNAAPNKLALFHKTATGNTVIMYEFREADAILTVSKSDGKRRSIALALHEELLLQRYLELALDAHLRVGKR